jgi:drug/metabolite transporter (DMT)-like permease
MHTTPGSGPRPRGVEAALVLIVLVWGVNYSLLKIVFAEMDPMAFNVVRFALASAVLLALIALVRRDAPRAGAIASVLRTAAPVSRRDWCDLVWLGLVGHCVYQFCFSSGLPRTSVSTSALIMATTPVIVSTASALLGRERLRPLHWAGILVSLVGVTVVVGASASLGGGTLTGDVLMVMAAGCWAVFTIGGTRLMTRHSPLFVSGVTTAIGTAGYALAAAGPAWRVAWRELPAFVWGAAVFSGLLSIAAAYLVWYAAIQRIGPARTSIYANMVPIAAMGIAAVWLREPVTLSRIAGAAAVLTGVILTRLARPAAIVPSEE